MKYKIIGIGLIVFCVVGAGLAVFYISAYSEVPKLPPLPLYSKEAVQELKSDVIEVEIYEPGKKILIIYEEGPTNDIARIIPEAIPDGLNTVYAIQEWRAQLFRKYEEQPEVMKVHNFPLDGSFSVASISPDKGHIIIGVKGIVGGNPTSMVLGSLNLVTGELFMDSTRRFSGNVKELVWMDNDQFVLITDSELSLCHIAVSDFAESCAFKLEANDIKIELGAADVDKFLPDFRAIRWNNDDKTWIDFTTNANPRSILNTGDAYWSIKISGDFLTKRGSVGQLDPEAEKIGISLGCEAAQEPANCFTLAQNIFIGGVGTTKVLVGSDMTDEETIQYFTDRFPGMKDVVVSSLPIQIYKVRRGSEEFERRVRKKLLSFKSDIPGGSTLSIAFLSIVPDDINQGSATMGGFLLSLGENVDFQNKPLYLVADRGPLFLMNFRPQTAQCFPMEWTTTLYEIEDRDLKNVWSNAYYRNGRVDKSASIENVYTEIRFEDLDGDGNQEIIQEGTRNICIASEGGCYSGDCDVFTESAPIRNIFQWNPQTKIFEEQG